MATRYALVLEDTRRCVLARIKSNSRGRAVRHEIRVLKGGFVTCTCEDFKYRHRASRPTVLSQHVCRHVRGFRVALVTEALAKGLLGESDVTRAIESLTVEALEGYLA